MKIERQVIWGAILMAVFTVTALAQIKNRSIQDVQSVVSLAREAAAVEPVVQKIVPEYSETGPAGTYYSVQLDQPPLPFNPFPELEVVELDPMNGIYLLNDLNVDYEVLNELIQAVNGLNVPEQRGDLFSTMSLVAGEPVLGISSLGGGLLDFTLTNAVSNAVYDLYFITNVAAPHWQWRRVVALGFLPRVLNRIERRHQIADAYFQCFGNLPQRFNRDLLLRPLDFPDVVPVEISLLRQLLLTKFGFLSFGSDCFAHNPIKLLRRHHDGLTQTGTKKSSYRLLAVILRLYLR